MGSQGAGGREALKVAAAVVVVLTGGAPQAQDADLSSLRLAAAAASARFVQDFTNVVADEDYREWVVTQRAPKRVRSDYLLVRFPGAEGRWLEFRDVREVNGRAVGGRDDRATRLFLEPFDDAYGRAMEIGAASAEHLPALYRPFMGLTYLQASYQRAFRFRVDTDRLDGVPVQVLEFTHNTAVALEIAAGGRQVSGRAWIDAGAPRILRTRMTLGEGRRRVDLVTSFGRDDRLGIGVPVEMQVLDANGQIAGVLTYSGFRRFEVRTEEVIAPPGQP